MSGLTYPREWFRVSHWGGQIDARVMVRETAAKLVFMVDGKERMTAKSSSYDAWYPTREEAEAKLAEIRAQQDQRAARERLNAAAPKLAEEARLNLEAWQNVLEFGLVPHTHRATVERRIEAARAALAKAGLL